MKRTTIVELIVFLYSGLFLYTGISKVSDYNAFKEQLLESPILTSVAGQVAVAVPLIEFLIVFFLVIPRSRLKGLYSALFLMVAFTVYVIALLASNDKLPCSCGGIISTLSWQQHILFNSFFIILGLLGIFLQINIIKRDKKLLKLNIA